MIEPRQWKALWLFSRTGKLTNTAREMYLFQPALSAMMQRKWRRKPASVCSSAPGTTGSACRLQAGWQRSLPASCRICSRQLWMPSARPAGAWASVHRESRFYLEKPGQLKTEENLQGWDTEMLEDDRDLEAGLDSGRWQAVILHLPGSRISGAAAVYGNPVSGSPEPASSGAERQYPSGGSCRSESAAAYRHRILEWLRAQSPGGCPLCFHR